MAVPARVAKAYIYSTPFKGLPKKSNFKIVEERLPSLKDGEYLAEAIYLRAGPDARKCKLGATFGGTQVAKIIESKNKDFAVGKYIVGDFGWRTLTIGNGTDSLSSNGLVPPYLLPEIGDLCKSLAIGVLGLSGNAAYFGFLKVCKPKEGDVVVVSAAAGGVGSHVGQLAKIKGCKVIGITSSDEKGDWLINHLGFDNYINYKNHNVEEKLQEYAPNGVDCYFDTVGGQISSAVIYNMNTFGRICICGATSLYYCNEAPIACEVQTPIKIKHVKMEGMQVNRWWDRWSEGIQQNLQWIREGKLKYQESVTVGFENIFEAFIDTLQGGNVGNAIVKI